MTNFFLVSNFKKNLNIIIFYLVIIFPFALVSGPFLPDLICVLCSIFFLLIISKDDFKKYFYNKFSICFIIFCTYIIFNSLISISPAFSLESSLFYFRFGLFSICVWYLIENNKKFLNIFSISLSICFTILLFDGFFEYFIGFNLIGNEYNTVKVTSFFGTEEKLGSYLSRLFPLFFGLFLIKKSHSKVGILYLFLIFILTNLLVFLSGERTSFFYQLMSSFIFIIMISKFYILRLTTLIFSFLLISLIIISNESIYKRMIVSTIESFSAPSLVEKNAYKKDKSFIKNSSKNSFLDNYNIFSEQHESHYRIAYNMFIEKPFIGHGPKLFRVQCQNEDYYKIYLEKQETEKYVEIMKINSCNTHPHNYYLQLLAETGILGALPLFLLFLTVSFLLLKNLFSLVFNNRFLNDYHVGLLSCLLITLWPISPNGNFFGNWLSLVIYTPVGFILYEIRSFLQFKRRE